MKKLIKSLLVVPVVSFLLCGCKSNQLPSDESSPNVNTSFESESNWEEMITNFGLFTSAISWEAELISDNGEGGSAILRKDDTRFSYQYFYDDEENETNYFSFDRNSLKDGNVYTWTIYGEKGEVVDYPIDWVIAEFCYPFGFDKNELTYDSSSKSYKAETASYTLESEAHTFNYKDVEMKFNDGVLTYVELYRESGSHSMGSEDPTLYVKEQYYFRHYGEVSITIPN